MAAALRLVCGTQSQRRRAARDRKAPTGKNPLFVGHDDNAANLAILYSLIKTRKLKVPNRRPVSPPLSFAWSICG
jgi:hypothetical protein